MSRLMGYWARKRMAVVMALSLAVVSFPGDSGTAVIHAGAAVQEEEPAGRQEQADISAIQQTQDDASDGQEAQEKQAIKKKPDRLRGAGETGTSTVVFSKGSGTYGEEFNLELSCATEADIYYTADGSDPSDPNNEARQLYTADGIRIADRKGDPNVLSAIDPILFDAVNVKPSEDGKSFESTIEKPSDEDVDKCTVIKAAAQYADGTCSEVTTNTYFIGEMADHIEGIRKSCEAAGMDLSVMSISMDADDLFDSTKGIYVKGDVFEQALADYIEQNGEVYSAEECRSMDANYKQKGRSWERATHIDYFESNGTDTSCKLQQDCGIRIQGNYSRSDYQKSFRLYARADYGEKNFKYGFWNQATDDQGQVIEKYKKIVLRNGGNCAFTTKFSDAYWQSLMKGIDCDTQSARPCVVYLNGEYWGVYILQDDFCDAYFENKHGVDKNNIVVYKGDAEANRVLGYKLDEGTLPEGVTNEDYYFEDLEKFMAEHDDLSNQADYEAFCQLVDKDSALDYFATQVWINNKWDWPGKNWSMWKSTQIDPNNPYADGKWRYLIYDVEFGGISGSGDCSANTVKESKLLSTGTADKNDDNWDKPNVRCFALFMTNPEFREAFKTRLAGFSDGMFERSLLLDRADLFKNVYQPILDQFFNRFPTLWDGDKKTADMAINGNGWDTYGTWANIVAFAKGRAENIETITKWIDRKYPAAATPTPELTPEPTPTPQPSDSPAPSAVPTQDSGQPVQVILSDGAKKIVQTDQSGKVISTKYQVEGVTYSLKSDKTLAYSVDNNKALKKKTSCVIMDMVVAGGNRYKVTEIEAGALQNLKKLKSVTIGENVRTIGKNAFFGCKKLKEIRFLGKKVKNIGSKAFDGIAKKAKIKCPKAKKKAYQKLIQKSGINLKAKKIQITASALKGNAAGGKTAGNSDVASTGSKAGGQAAESAAAKAGNQTAVSLQKKKAENTASVTMSSLQIPNGSYQNASKGMTVTISSAEELRMLSEYTKSKHTTSGITFLQTAEIDGTGIAMEPIGVTYVTKYDYGDGEWDTRDEDIPFQGTYDGGGYSVKNLTISVKKSDADYYYLSMFGCVENAVLQNIVLDSIAFVNEEDGTPFTATADTVVRMAGISASGLLDSITGCTNHADITAAGRRSYAVGIAMSAGIISGCINDGNITAGIIEAAEEDDERYAEAFAGGIAYGVDSIEGCTNSGQIQSDDVAVGMVRYVEQVTSDCVNEGAISGKNCAAGIIISDGTEVTKCTNYGTVDSDVTAAGVLGGLFGTITNCENHGVITSKQDAGGIVGLSRYWCAIYAVRNTGEVNGERAAGGIVARMGSGSGNSGVVGNVQNTGNICGQVAAGGIAGGIFGGIVGNAWNHGEISGALNVGGIVGSSDAKSFQDENISTSNSLETIYFDCVNAGTVSGGTKMGTVVGCSSAQDQLSYCYILDGEELAASGTDAALTAEKVQAETLKAQEFLDPFNQNMEERQDIAWLPVSYDHDAEEWQWQPRLFLELETYASGYVDGSFSIDGQLKDRFTVKNSDTGETVAFQGENGLYYIEAEQGVSYEISYRSDDGAEQTLHSDLSVREGEYVYIQNRYIRFFSFYTAAEQVMDEDEYDYYMPTELFQRYFCINEEELYALWPDDPQKEGYEFGGWYRSAVVTSPEWYQQTKEARIGEFQESEERYHEWWEEAEDWLLDSYESEEDYVSQNMIQNYGTDNFEEYKNNYDTYYDQDYKVENIQDGLWWEEDCLYAKWYIPGAAQTPEPSMAPAATATPGPALPQQTPSVSDTKQIDPAAYQDPVGNYVQKQGVIYKVDRKKKTASLVGVTSKSVTKITIAAKVQTGGNAYPVTSVSKNAFQGCSGLKKITAKEKSLKKVKQKALKMIRKKK